jgi:hypothetical protein
LGIPISTCVDITVYQCGKCFIFVTYIFATLDIEKFKMKLFRIMVVQKTVFPLSQAKTNLTFATKDFGEPIFTIATPTAVSIHRVGPVSELVIPCII